MPPHRNRGGRSPPSNPYANAQTARRDQTLRERGSSASTRVVVGSAVAKFDLYRVAIGEAKLDNIQQSEIAAEESIQTILGDWALHLSNNPLRHTRGRVLAAETHVKYLRLVLAQLKALFGDHPDFRDGYENRWQKAQEDGLKRNIQRYIIAGVHTDDGVSGTKVTLPLYRRYDHSLKVPGFDKEGDLPDLETIVTKIMQKPNYAQKHEKRLELGLVYHGVARANEGKLMNYEEISYDSYLNCVCAQWKELKVLKEYPTTFTIDHDSYKFCMLDMLSDYWAVGNGLFRAQMPKTSPQPKSRKAVLVMSQGRSSHGLGDSITKTLQDNVPPAFKTYITAKSLRVGGTTFLTSRNDVTDRERLARTGHTDPSNAEHYTAKTTGIQLAPMTALAGFPDARKKVLLPREILVDGISTEDALNIMKKFYSPINIEEFKEGGKLYQLLRVVFFRSIMSFNDKLQDLGPTYDSCHKLVVSTRDVLANSLDIPAARTVVKRWSKAVKIDFDNINSGLQIDAVESSAMMASLVTAVTDVKRLNATLLAEVRSLADKQERIEAQQERMEASHRETHRETLEHLQALVQQQMRPWRRRSSNDNNNNSNDNNEDEDEDDDNNNNNKRPRSPTDSAEGRGGGYARLAYGPHAEPQAGTRGVHSSCSSIERILLELSSNSMIKEAPGSLVSCWLTRLPKKEKKRFQSTMALVERLWTTEEKSLLLQGRSNDDAVALQEACCAISRRCVTYIWERENVGKDIRRMPKTNTASYMSIGKRYAKLDTLGVIPRRSTRVVTTGSSFWDWCRKDKGDDDKGDDVDDDDGDVDDGDGGKD